jgi:two-component system, NarL family, response regulator YdfI
LRLLLETADHLEVVGEAENGRVALTLAADLQPDVILMDLRMPEMDGLTAIGHLQAEQPHIAVIILTTYNEDEMMLRGLQAGARGYLLKDMSRDSLIDTIEAAVRGDTLLKPEILQRVLAAQQPAAAPVVAADIDLTERELEVLRWRPRGKPTRESGCAWGSRTAPSRPISAASTTSWAWTRVRGRRPLLWPPGTAGWFDEA